MADAWTNVANKIAGNVIPATDFNTVMANLRVLGGNGVTAPTSDIEALKALVDVLVAPTSGAGAPGSTPTVIGQIYVDTTAKRMYIATGTGSSADWDKVPYIDYGVGTITAGAGDLAITLPQSWEGGTLFVWLTNTVTEFMNDVTGTATWITTYDSLTDTEATYSTAHSMSIQPASDAITIYTKNTAVNACPVSATPLGFVLNDQTTCYIKWMVMA